VKQAEGVRTAAFTALAQVDPAAHIGRLGAALRAKESSNGLRQALARTLVTLNRKEARDELLASFAAVSSSIGTTIAIGLSNTPQGCETILRGIETGKVSPQVLGSRAVDLNMTNHLRGDAAKRLASIRSNLPAVDQKINELIRDRFKTFTASKPDAELGAKLYTKHCAACHQLGGQGSKVGPQLDGIGARSAERLLEDILDPNRNVDPTFRSTRISLKSGQDLQGLVLREEGEVVVLSDNLGKEVRVEKKNIEEKVTTPLSAMPANWADLIPAEELNHLLAHLLRQHGKPPGEPKQR
jgi:putative heme-binding domain-containing protein